jgi:V/A-type H+-transporting ATPase subunit B
MWRWAIAYVALGDRVQIRGKDGRRRNGQVIRTSRDVVLVQVFEGTDNLDLENTWVRFLDQPFELALSPDMLGRNFNGIGAPRDDRPPLVSRSTRPRAPTRASLFRPGFPPSMASTR